MEIFKLLGTIAINNSEANSSIDETTVKAEKSENKISSAFKKIGSAVVTYFAVDKIKSFGTECVNMASDVQEMQNKFDVVFSGMTEEVEQWANDYASAIGRNSNAIKGYLADNQNMFVGMGMTREEGANLSEQMVSLALDLASFNNLQEDDAVNAMSKAIMGETESAKSLGAVLNDNTRAMAMEQLGYEGKYDALTESQKMEVNYQAILMQSADAVGDCERSLDSYKGQQIQAQSTTENLKESIGTRLLPVMTALTGKYTEFVGYITQYVDPVFDTLSYWADVIQEKYATYVEPAIGSLKESFGLLLDSLSPLFDKFSEFIGGVTSGAEPIDILDAAMQTLSEVIQTVADGISTVSTWISEHQGAIEVMATIIGSVAAAVLLVNTAVTAWNVVAGIATGATTALGAAVSFLTSPIFLVTAAIAAVIAIGVLLYKNWDTIKAKAIELKNSIVGKFNEIKTKVETVVSNVKESVVGKFEDIRSGVVEKFENIRSGIVEKIENAKETVKGVIEKIKGFFGFDVSLPKIKLPHFSISPSGWKISDLLEGSIPSLGIDWYAKAMDDPMVMTKPTAFGINANGQVMAGGEKGSEVVSGTDTLMNMISDAVASNNNGIIDAINRLLEFLQMYIPEMSRMQLVMDSGAVVGELAPAMDVALGKLAVRSERGV